MDNTVEVSIAGIGFSLDHEAYRILRRYLDRLEAGYGDSADGREIIADIEARIAEIILDKQECEQVVDSQFAESIVARLGYPDDMPSVKEDDIVDSNFPRRLYRNAEGAKLGGVCSGLATYFDIDPVWLRVGIFVPFLLSVLSGVFPGDFFAGGFLTLFIVFVMLYFILWFVLPKATTPRQKLEMRGKKVTAREIGESISNDFKESAKNDLQKKNASILSEIFYVIGQILLFLLKAFVIFLLFGLITGVLALIVVFFALLLAPLDLMAQLSVPVWWTLPTILMVLAVVIVPLLVIVWGLMRWLFKSKKKMNRTALAVIGSIWIIITVFTIIMTMRDIHEGKFDNISIGHVKTGNKDQVENDKYWDDNWIFDERGRAHPKREGIGSLDIRTDNTEDTSTDGHINLQENTRE